MAPSTVRSVLPGPRHAHPALIGATALGLTATFLLLVSVRPGGSPVVVPSTDVATTLAALAATVSCAVTARRHLDSMRWFWLLLAAACGAWAAGETAWTWYEVILDVPVPSPSWADVAYLAGTPLSVAAFACHPAARRRQGPRAIPVLDALAVAGAVLLVSWAAVLGPQWQQSGGALGDVVALAYPVGDVAVLVLILVALTRMPSGNTPSAALLLGALLVMAVSDSLYTVLTRSGSYDSGGLLDVGWFAAYVMIAAAAQVHRWSPEETRDRPTAAPLLALVPLLPVVSVLGVIAVALPRGGEPDGVERAVALVLCLLMVTRLGLAVGRPLAHRTARHAPAAPPPATGARAEGFGELTLAILAARAPTAQERVQQVSATLMSCLGALAAAVAVWDLSLLVS